MRKLSPQWSFVDPTGRKHTATVYRDSENDEFVVRLSIDGKHQTRADYFTNDKTDAIGTAKAMARRSCGPVTQETL